MYHHTQERLDHVFFRMKQRLPLQSTLHGPTNLEIPLISRKTYHILIYQLKRQ